MSETAATLAAGAQPAGGVSVRRTRGVAVRTQIGEERPERGSWLGLAITSQAGAESLIGCVGMPMGRVSPPVPFGICTRRTGGAQYAPTSRVPRASGGCPPGLARSPRPSGRRFLRHRPCASPIGFAQPFQVKVLVQGGQSLLRHLFRQLCYPSLSRVHGSGVRCLRHVSLLRFDNSTPRFPPPGPRRCEFPGFCGTIRAL